jgi:hypothetical protein
MTDDPTNETDEVATLEADVRAVFEQNPSASPAWLATAAMQSIGFRREIHPVGYWAAHRTLERIASAVAGGMDQDQIVRWFWEGVDPAADTDYDVYDDADALQARADAFARHADLLEAEAFRSDTGGDEPDGPRQ